jgi:pSer/pThr/pTyr-binding forkhead associated (FHA) protein
VFHDGTGKQHAVTLDDEQSPITVGRRDDNHVALAWDHEVSRRHARLLRAPAGWTLVDDESRNGSYLNGQRVSEPHPLRDGDVLRFGDTVVLFRAPVADEERRPAVSLQPEQVTYMGKRPTPAPRPLEE